MPDEPETPEQAADDLASRLAALGADAETIENARREVLEIGAEYEERLNEFQTKLDAAQEDRQARRRDNDRRQALDREAMRGAGVGLQVAYIIIGTPLFFYFLGWLLDRGQGTDFFKGIGMLVGATIGVALAIWIASRSNARSGP